MSTFPIRCFTCGKLINHRWKEYEQRAKEYADTKDLKDSPAQVLDEMGFSRMCCRRHFITHATSALEEICAMYPVNKDRIERMGVRSHNSFEKSRAHMEATAAMDDD